MPSFRIPTLVAVVLILTSGHVAYAQLDSDVDVAAEFEEAVEEALEFLPPENQGLWYAHEPRVGFGHDVGEGIGYDRSFTTFEGFVPLFRESEQSLLFTDLRLLLDNDSLVGGNVGLGSRRYLAALDRTLGAFVYYDVRQTGTFTFQQLSLGFDLLGDDWDLRTNVYLPGIIDDRNDLPNLFRGNALFINRNEAAMSGLDMEFGIPVRLAEKITPKLYAGWYHFQESERPQVWGWRIRAEARASENLTFDVSVQNDQLFDTTVNFGVALRFPTSGLKGLWPPSRSIDGLGGLAGGPARWLSARERLAAPVERLQNIVVDQQESVALHASTGTPFFFLHVAANLVPATTLSGPPGKQGSATNPATGTIEAPFTTLAQAFADPQFAQGNVVVYDRTGGTFTGNVTIASGSQLRSNGPVQRVSTQFGSQILPFSGVDPNRNNAPSINGTITLASNTILSGFNVNGQGVGPAVRINGVSGSILISNNTIQNNAASAGAVTELLPDGATLTPDISQAGIFDNGAGADVTISDNTIQTAGTAILLAATGTTFNIDDNTITVASGGNQANGIDLRSFISAQVGARLRRNTVNASATNNSAGGMAQIAAINLQTSGSSQLEAFLIENTIDVDATANGANGVSSATGVSLQSAGTSMAALLIQDSNIDTNALATGANGTVTSIGSQVSTTGSANVVIARISTNTINSTATAGAGGGLTVSGMLLSAINSSRLTSTLNNNTVNSGIDGIVATTSNTANLCLNATQNQSNPGAGGFGFRITNNGGTLRVLDRDNLSQNNGNATVNLFGTITDVMNCD